MIADNRVRSGFRHDKFDLPGAAGSDISGRYIFEMGYEYLFAHTSFKWSNLAAHNAGVTVVDCRHSEPQPKTRLTLFSEHVDGSTVFETLTT